MRKSLIALTIFAIGGFILYQPTAAYAQATRTWVSGVGDDANPCSRTAPCKTFAGAISKTAPAGEIDNLDAGGFGALTITKSITIDGSTGGEAGVLVAGTNGIVVAAGSNDVVILKNLEFLGLLGNGTGSGFGLSGIVFNSGAALIIENCAIIGFQNNGIAITPNTNSKVVIRRTRITNTATATGNAAILINPTANVNVTINNSSMENQLNGIFATGSSVVHVQVRDSTITNSTNNGVTFNAANGNADVINTLISYSNTNGVVTGAGTVTLGGDTITNNVAGVATAGGTLLSFKNNQITDNTNNGTPITAVTGNSGTLQ